MMKSQESSIISVKYHLALVALSLLGVVIVLLATNRYGAGLSPDSVQYIAIARNLINGEGLENFAGGPLIKWPPLYPALLALVAKIFATDPVMVANEVNALLFGLIVYLGGLLALRYFRSYISFAFVGMLAIIFSVPLLLISGMAWTEPLFICFTLLSLIFAHSYVLKNDVVSLILFASAVALAVLTRYIGVVLIGCGAVIIVLVHRDSIKERIKHLFLFMVVVGIPVGIWLIRNYSISGTFFADRGASRFTLSQNLELVSSGLAHWVFFYNDYRFLMNIVLAVVGLLAVISLIVSWPIKRDRLRHISPLLLFVTIYLGFLVISSTTTSYDPIDYRLLSPIYVPLTVLLLFLVQAIFEPYLKYLSDKVAYALLIILFLMMLVFPIRMASFSDLTPNSEGRGYSGKNWSESETVQYFLEHQNLESECDIYTNDPYGIYVWGDIKIPMSPWRPGSSSADSNAGLTRLGERWPAESGACLIWFNAVNRKYLFTVDELTTIANIDVIARLPDGTIYSITRK